MAKNNTEQKVNEPKEPVPATESEEVKKLKAELEASNEALDAERKKKYAPEPMALDAEQKDLPEGMQDAQVKTTVRDMTSVIAEKMQQMKDLATMEVMMDTGVRMQNRFKSIKEMGSAVNMKIRGQWKTTPPKMHITKLEAKKINNDEYEISFGVYHCDAKGNKTIFTEYADVTMHDGSTIKRATSAEYRVAYEVIETIKTGKPITREVVKINRA